MDDKNSMILKFGVLFKNTGRPPKICEVLENIMTKKIQRTGRSKWQASERSQMTQLEKLGDQQSTLGSSREAARSKEAGSKYT